MSLTKQHFEHAAAIVRDMNLGQEMGDYTAGEVEAVESAFLSFFARWNGRFDRTRFKHACRGEDAHDSAGRRVRYSNGG